MIRPDVMDLVWHIHPGAWTRTAKAARQSGTAEAGVGTEPTPAMAVAGSQQILWIQPYGSGR